MVWYAQLLLIFTYQGLNGAVCEAAFVRWYTEPIARPTHTKALKRERETVPGFGSVDRCNVDVNVTETNSLRVLDHAAFRPHQG